VESGYYFVKWLIFSVIKLYRVRLSYFSFDPGLGLTIRREGEVLVLLGFQEGGKITTMGVVAFLIVNFFGFFLRVAVFFELVPVF
jgi:hypothetical protein